MTDSTPQIPNFVDIDGILDIKGKAVLLEITSTAGRVAFNVERDKLRVLIKLLMQAESNLEELDPTPIDAELPLENAIRVDARMLQTVKSPPMGEWLLMRHGSLDVALAFTTPREKQALISALTDRGTKSARRP